jgi:hypothetical protein
MPSDDSMESLLFPSDVREHQDYKDAKQFRENIDPYECVDYDWAWDYARANFDRIYAVGKELDDKANDIIKHLSAGIVLFTLVVLVNIRPENMGILGLGLFSFVAALISIFLAVLVRIPMPFCLPGTIREAFHYAGYFGDPQRARGAFLGHWHQASEGLRLINNRKARLVERATWIFFAAVLLLLVPILGAVCGIN